MITPAKVIFAMICGFLAGLVFFMQTIDWYIASHAPVVTGQVVSRTPTSWLSIPRVDFTIRIEGTDTDVHARTQRGMIDKVPAVVRFHYTGDPKRNVFLFEQELNPGWLVLLFWGAALLLSFSLWSTRIREWLGWIKRDSHEIGA
jgi:hypothetical protein